MATVDFDDLDYGDETRRNGDYVGLPHDQDQSNGSSDATNDVAEGMAVTVDAQGNIAAAEDGENVVGVLYTYQYYEDGQTGESIDQDRNATVKTQGTVKAYVASDTAAGEALAPDSTNEDAGVLANTNGSANTSNIVALSDAKQQDVDGTTRYYAEVLLR
jgi:hypothetical protein